MSKFEDNPFRHKKLWSKLKFSDGEGNSNEKGKRWAKKHKESMIIYEFIHR